MQVVRNPQYCLGDIAIRSFRRTSGEGIDVWALLCLGCGHWLCIKMRSLRCASSGGRSARLFWSLSLSKPFGPHGLDCSFVIAKTAAQGERSRFAGVNRDLAWDSSVMSAHINPRRFRDFGHFLKAPFILDDEQCRNTHESCHDEWEAESRELTYCAKATLEYLAISHPLWQGKSWMVFTLRLPFLDHFSTSSNERFISTSSYLWLNWRLRQWCHKVKTQDTLTDALNCSWAHFVQSVLNGYSVKSKNGIFVTMPRTDCTCLSRDPWAITNIDTYDTIWSTGRHAMHVILVLV